MREQIWQSSHSLGLSLPNTIVSTVEQDDVALVLASKQGDQQAFACLVQRYQRRVFNLAYRMLQHYEEASEITQEAFLAAWQGLPGFRGDAQFSTWLYRITYNCALKQLDQRKREIVLHEALQTEGMLEQEKNFRHAGEVEEALDRRAMLLKHLSQLPAKYRVVLILRHLQDMTYEEMAEILTMPIGTIKTHLFRARNLLKERLQARQADVGTRGQ